ncbi:hypothetical protein [Bdellovibrio sp. HCB337]|uniref:hypothetical protein n=1 Tax=Bdellovibrio sp. HCB337 TaxID=3394358 RepID=UPI0039A547F0
MGYVDGIVSIGGIPHIAGWACDYRQNTSIAVHLYVNGPAGQGGIKIGSYKAADLTTGTAISSRCETSQVSHRFHIPIYRDTIAKYAKQAIYVHGISVSNGSNLVLQNSGQFEVPTVTSQFIDGNIDTFLYAPQRSSIAGTVDRVISGWACDTGAASPIEIHLYARGPAGRGGEFVKKALANIDAGASSAVAQRCGFQNGAHRFEILLTEDEANRYAGASLYIHGISISKTGFNGPIQRSGILLVPPKRILVTSVAALYSAVSKVKDSGGGIIEVAKGSYNLNQSLHLGANTALVVNSQAILIRGTSGGLFMNPSTATGYDGIGNLLFIGGIYQGSAFILAHASHIIFRDIKFVDTSASHALDLAALKNVWVEGCKFLGVVNLSSNQQYKEAIQVDGDSSDSIAFGAMNGTPNINWTVRGNYFGANPNGASNSQAWPTGVGGHNVFYDRFPQYIVIENNTFEKLLYAGVRVYKWRDTIIRNNAFKDSARAVLAQAVPWNSPSAMTVQGQASNASQAGARLTIESNTLIGTKLPALQIQGVTGNSTPGTRARWESVTITKNTVTYPLEHVVFLENAKNFSVSSNQIENIPANKTGVLLNLTDSGVIQSNLLQGGKVGGIEAPTSTNTSLTVKGNTWVP